MQQGPDRRRACGRGRAEDGGAVVVARKTGAALPVKVLASSGADALVEGALAPGGEVAADAARALAAAGRDAS